MITRSMTLFSVLLLWATVLPTTNGQVIVEDTDIRLFDFGVGTTRPHQLAIMPTLSSLLGDPSDVTFTLQPAASPTIFPPLPPTAELTGSDVAAYERADLYVAEAGEIFSLNTINDGNFQPLIEGDSFSSAIVGPGIFFLAIAASETDLNFLPQETGRDVFGWARLNLDDQFNITLLDNAVAYGTGNIIIGQNAFAVPEPSSGIVFVTLLGLGVARRRKRSS